MVQKSIETLLDLFLSKGPYGPVVEEKDTDVVPVTDTKADTETVFLRGLGRVLGNIKGREFGIGVGDARLKVLKVSRPIRDSKRGGLEFVVPLTVRYFGIAAPSEWAEAENAIENEISGGASQLASEMFGGKSVRLVRRRKSDPYKGDPRSLTLLRFRVV
jgi:hypothetical protein